MNIEKVIRLGGYYDMSDTLMPIKKENDILGSAEQDILEDLEEIANNLSVVPVINFFCDNLNISKNTITEYCKVADKTILHANIGLALVDALTLYKGGVLNLNTVADIEDVLNCYIEVFPSMSKRLLSIGNNPESYDNRGQSIKFTNIYNSYIASKSNKSIEGLFEVNDSQQSSVTPIDTTGGEMILEAVDSVESSSTIDFSQFDREESNVESGEKSVLEEFFLKGVEEEIDSNEPLLDLETTNDYIEDNEGNNELPQLGSYMPVGVSGEDDSNNNLISNEITDTTNTVDTEVELVESNSIESLEEGDDLNNEIADSAEIATAEIATAEVATTEVATTEVATTEVATTESEDSIQITEVNPIQKDNSKKQLNEMEKGLELNSEFSLKELKEIQNPNPTNCNSYKVEQGYAISQVAENPIDIEQSENDSIVSNFGTPVEVKVTDTGNPFDDISNGVEVVILEENNENKKHPLSVPLTAIEVVDETLKNKVGLILAKTRVSSNLSEELSTNEAYKLIVEISGQYQSMMDIMSHEHVEKIKTLEDSYNAKIETLDLEIKKLKKTDISPEDILADEVKKEYEEEILRLTTLVADLAKLVPDNKKDNAPELVKIITEEDNYKVKEERKEKEQILKSSKEYANRNDFFGNNKKLDNKKGVSSNEIIDNFGFECIPIQQKSGVNNYFNAPSKRRTDDVRKAFATQLNVVKED